VNPDRLIEKWYGSHPTARRYLLMHSRAVADFALRIADRSELVLDRTFIEEAALLHDVGIIGTDAPDIGCHGTEPYIAHGIIGARMLAGEGLARHARVCECHVGLGLFAQDIEEQRLPLPCRDMVPATHEERIVCLADKFFSKGAPDLRVPLSMAEVRRRAAAWGQRSRDTLEAWTAEYFPNGPPE